MANEEHLAILRRGVEEWNEWLIGNPNEIPDLSGANLNRANLSGVYLMGTHLEGTNLYEAELHKAALMNAELDGAVLYGANLNEANLHRANLHRADLRRANLNEALLSEADLHEAELSEAKLLRALMGRVNLSRAKLSRANLSGAFLNGANLSWSVFRGANLSGAFLRGVDLTGATLSFANLIGADLRSATLVDAELNEAILSQCRIYGVSAWNIALEGATQSDLIISDEDEPEITVDNLEIAQFVYMLLHNEKIRDVIDTLTTKSVLILGRFTDERKAVLDAIKNELRQRNYVPILFDFEKPASRDLTETIVTLAHLSRFVIADITDAKSIPQELQAIVPNLLSVPVQPIILAAQREYALFEHFRRYPSVLPLHEYDSQAQLIAKLAEWVIEPAERKVVELRKSS